MEDTTLVENAHRQTRYLPLATSNKAVVRSGLAEDEAAYQEGVVRPQDRMSATSAVNGRPQELYIDVTCT
jgi:hypothetical protein